jgi:hypothetical protein
VYQVIERVIQARFQGGMQVFGLKESGVAWVHEGPHAAKLPAVVVQRVEQLRCEITSGQRSVHTLIPPSYLRRPSQRDSDPGLLVCPAQPSSCKIASILASLAATASAPCRAAHEENSVAAWVRSLPSVRYRAWSPDSVPMGLAGRDQPGGGAAGGATAASWGKAPGPWAWISA